MRDRLILTGVGSLLNRGDLNLRELLENLKRESYLFQRNYPSLNKLLKEDEVEFAVRKYDKTFRNHKILSEIKCSDLIADIKYLLD